MMNIDSRFQVIRTEIVEPEPYREDSLRISRIVRNQSNSWNIYGTGESTLYTNSDGIQYIKDHLSYCNDNNLRIAALRAGMEIDRYQFLSAHNLFPYPYPVIFSGPCNNHRNRKKRPEHNLCPILISIPHNDWCHCQQKK